MSQHDHDGNEGLPESAPQNLELTETSAPADPRLVGRRLVLKLAAGSALAGIAAASASDADAATACLPPGTALPKPSVRSLQLVDVPAVLMDESGKEGQYRINGVGSLTIDPQGIVRLSNLSANGAFMGGAVNVGPISIQQGPDEVCNANAGKYIGGVVYASAPIVYNDATYKDQPGTLSLSGNLNSGGGDLIIGVDFRSPYERPGIGIVVRWTRAC